MFSVIFCSKKLTWNWYQKSFSFQERVLLAIIYRIDFCEIRVCYILFLCFPSSSFSDCLYRLSELFIGIVILLCLMFYLHRLDGVKGLLTGMRLLLFIVFDLNGLIVREIVCLNKLLSYCFILCLGIFLQLHTCCGWSPEVWYKCYALLFSPEVTFFCFLSCHIYNKENNYYC